MSTYPMLTRYVSEIDQFLQAFDQNHPELSKSQQYEQAKYRRIYSLRDNPAATNHSSQQLWEDF